MKKFTARKVDLLMKELELINQRGVALTTVDTSLLYLSLAVFGVGFGFGTSNQENLFSNYLLIFFPLAIYCIIFYFIHLYIIIESLFGYKKALENYINENILYQDFLISERINENFHLKSKGLYFSYFGYAILLIISICVSIAKANDVFYKTTTFMIFCGHILFISILGYLIIDLKNTFKKSFNYSKFQIENKHKKAEKKTIDILKTNAL